MATSKYGLGKYGFRLYSAVPFKDYAGVVVVSVLSVGTLSAALSFNAIANVQVSASADYQRNRSFAGYSLVEVNAFGDLWTAHTQDFSGLAEILVAAGGHYQRLMEFAGVGLISINATGNAYFGPQWGENECEGVPWLPKECEPPIWSSETVSGGWEKATEPTVVWSTETELSEPWSKING